MHVSFPATWVEVCSSASSVAQPGQTWWLTSTRVGSARLIQQGPLMRRFSSSASMEVCPPPNTATNRSPAGANSPPCPPFRQSRRDWQPVNPIAACSWGKAACATWRSDAASHAKEAGGRWIWRRGGRGAGAGAGAAGRVGPPLTFHI